MVVKPKNEFELGFEAHVDGRFNPPANLRILLYAGAAAAHGASVAQNIDDGKYGAIRVVRFELVRRIHDYFERRLKNGYSKFTTKSDILAVRRFYSHHDALGIDVTASNVRELYGKYSSEKARNIEVGHQKKGTHNAYGLDKIMVRVFEAALELPPYSLKSSFNYSDLVRRGLIGRSKNDTGSISAGFQYGADLLDVTDQLTYEACLGELPVSLRFTDGASVECWARLAPPDRLRGPEGRLSWNVKASALKREHSRTHGSLKNRSSLINLRIDAEFNFFIAQTGMNSSVAYDLPMMEYRYSSWEDSYRVTAYKDRRKGNVEFVIYKEYRAYFDRYLAFIDRLFPGGCEYLFPFLNSSKDKRPDVYSQERLKKVFASAGKKCITLKSLRNRRVNWMLRETHDPVFTANAAQHSVGTMFSNYIAPNHHIATKELSTFFNAKKATRDSVAQGRCTSEISIVAIDEGAPIQPDCVNPAGCIFCEHYKGLLSFDYVWSMFSYHYLKVLELDGLPLNRVGDISSRRAVIERICYILEEFSAQGEECMNWYSEAKARMPERNFHPYFRGMIEVVS